MRHRPSAFDVAVIGAGPAGAAAAASAVRSGAKVALFDRGTRPAFRVGEGAPPGIEAVLADVFGGAADPFDRRDHLPSYGTVSWWGDDHPRAREHLFDPRGSGWHLDRARFDDRLCRAARAVGADVVTEDVRCSIHRGGRWSAIGSRWTARVVVDATGRSAVIARSQGAQRRVRDRLVAAVAVFEAPDDRDTATSVEATRMGWWHTALVPGRRRVVTFLTDADLLPSGARRCSGFLDLLARTAHINGCVRATANRFLFGPRVVAADTAVLHPAGGPGWLATGDAVASFDPLSSQGIVTALRLGQQAGRAAVVLADGGNDDPVAGYRRQRDSYVSEHLALRGLHYGDERRWSDATFWSRRHEASFPTDASPGVASSA